MPEYRYFYKWKSASSNDFWNSILQICICKSNDIPAWDLSMETESNRAVERSHDGIITFIMENLQNAISRDRYNLLISHYESNDSSKGSLYGAIRFRLHRKNPCRNIITFINENLQECYFQKSLQLADFHL